MSKKNQVAREEAYRLALHICRHVLTELYAYPNVVAVIEDCLAGDDIDAAEANLAQISWDLGCPTVIIPNRLYPSMDCHVNGDFLQGTHTGCAVSSKEASVL